MAFQIKNAYLNFRRKERNVEFRDDNGKKNMKKDKKKMMMKKKKRKNIMKKRKGGWKERMKEKVEKYPGKQTGTVTMPT